MEMVMATPMKQKTKDRKFTGNAGPRYRREPEQDEMNKRNETFVPLRLRRRQSQLVNTAQPAHDPGLLASIGRALYWQQLLDSGVVASFADLAEREGLTKPSVSHVLRLAQLAPELVERCLAGQQPRTLTQRWAKRQRLPDDWRTQRDLIDRFE